MSNGSQSDKNLSEDAKNLLEALMAGYQKHVGQMHGGAHDANCDTCRNTQKAISEVTAKVNQV